MYVIADGKIQKWGFISSIKELRYSPNVYIPAMK